MLRRRRMESFSPFAPGVPNGLLPIQPVHARIDLSGTFKKIRSFFWLVNHYPRFLTIVEASLKLDESSTRDENQPIEAIVSTLTI